MPCYRSDDRNRPTDGCDIQKKPHCGGSPRSVQRGEGDTRDEQSFPTATDGILYENMNRTIDDLRARLKGRVEQVYFYIVDTVKEKDGWFRQTGCGPNIEGGHVTL